MEAKKTPRANLENKRGLFLEIGLVFALVCSIIAFSIGQTEHTVELLDLGTYEIQEEMVEITRQEQQRPPEQQAAAEQRTVSVITDLIQLVKNDAVITTTFEFAEFNEDIVLNIQMATANIGGGGVVQEVEVEEAIPFQAIENKPRFQGSEDPTTFRNWVQTRMRYPAIASENGVHGIVTVTFVVDRDGSVTDIDILASPDRSLSDEAIRVLNTSPRWTPGSQRGEPVRVRYSIPVVFTLTN